MIARQIILIHGNKDVYFFTENKDKSMKNKTKATHPPKKKDNVLTVGVYYSFFDNKYQF